MANFHHAWETQYRAENFLHKDAVHINEVAFDGIHHNNQMESFNGATLRHREKVCRGLKKDDAAIISGLRLYHNFVHSHQGLPDQITPAEAAGITVEGTSKWMTLIHAAAKSPHYYKHAYAVEHRLGIKARADRGMLIHQSKDQVVYIASDHYLVRSQSGDGTYEIRNFGHGWMCSCPDHTYTGPICKHIQAVQWCVGERRTIQPHDDAHCKFCDSTNIVKKSYCRGKQQYWCKTCGRRFIQNLGFEMKHTTPEHICTAVDLLYSGLSSRKVSVWLKSEGPKITYRTVQNWGATYGKLMAEDVGTICPQVGEEWRTDELRLKRKGKKRYLFAMLDSDTRY